MISLLILCSIQKNLLLTMRNESFLPRKKKCNHRSHVEESKNHFLFTNICDDAKKNLCDLLFHLCMHLRHRRRNWIKKKQTNIHTYYKGIAAKRTSLATQNFFFFPLKFQMIWAVAQPQHTDFCWTGVFIAHFIFFCVRFSSLYIGNEKGKKTCQHILYNASV